MHPVQDPVDVQALRLAPALGVSVLRLSCAANHATCTGGGAPLAFDGRQDGRFGTDAWTDV